MQLRNWLAGLGLCAGCRFELAWFQQWREFVDPGHRIDRPTGCPNHTQPDCFAVAREHWKAMPARVTP